MNIEQRIRRFRDDLPQRGVPELVQKHITYGECFAFADEEYFDLKNRVGQKFGIHTSEVVGLD